MGKREVVNVDSGEWMITFMKTIDGDHVVYYRLTNMATYETMDVAAHKLMDEIINNNRSIRNIRCKNNQIYVTTEDGYAGTPDIIAVDEFDTDIPNIYEWVLSHGYLGLQVLDMYNKKLNLISPSNITVDSPEKIHWTCPKGHNIKLDFATLISLKCECPICSAKESNQVLSLKTWARLTENLELLEQYRSCEMNTVGSSKLAYDSKKMVYWKNKENNQTESMSAYDVTVKNKRPFEKREIINLSRR